MNPPFDQTPLGSGIDPGNIPVSALTHQQLTHDSQLAVAPPYQRTREMTIDEMLLENRVIFLVGEIHHASAAGVIMRMLHLVNLKTDMDISLYINSPGGSVDDTLAIYDTMQYLPCDIATYCVGRAYSGGAIVLAAGAKGKRFILPHARIMIHQPYGGVTGQASDVQIQAEEILKNKKQLNEILARHTDRDLKQIEEDSERDRYFSAKDAKDYGLVDEVLNQDEKK
ncbi:MAG: ATP-dependent Clp protease proteolytic subunit [Phycisphaeraceae bacterium]|nr:ATP-dependent Clp protease proteolytic subunit [Phycisphaeraceae bacterium]